MDDLLRSLASGPVPALAPPESVRRRGDQRRRRARAAVAGVSAVVVVAVGGLAAAVTGDATGRPDSLVPASSSPSASSAPSTVGGLGLVGALLQPSDAAAVLGGRWFSREGASDAPTPVLRACKDEPPTGGAGFITTLLDGEGGTLLSQVVVLPTDDVRAYLRAVARDAERCPAAASPPPGAGEGAPPRNTVVPVADEDVLVLKQVSVVCGERCEDETTYWVVVAVGEIVGFTKTDDPTTLDHWVDRIRARLRTCRGTCAPPERLHPQGFPDDAEVQPGQRTWVVTIGGTRPDGVADDPRQATRAAALLGYTATTVPVRCLDGFAAPGTSLPPEAEAVVVGFPLETAAATFQERFTSTVGTATEIARRQVTVRCLR